MRKPAASTMEVMNMARPTVSTLMAISMSTPRKCSDRFLAILSMKSRRTVNSPTRRWLKYSTGNRNSRDRQRLPAITDIRADRR